MWAEAALTFCRWAVGLTFAASALGKATAMDAFRDSVHDLGGVPARRVASVAAVTVALEALVAVVVGLGHAGAVAGFLLAAALLVVFTVVLGRALRRRDAVRCTCFGRSERPVTAYDVGRNALLLLACGGGLAAVGTASAPLELGPAVVLALVAAVFGLLATSLEDVVVTLLGTEAGR